MTTKQRAAAQMEGEMHMFTGICGIGQYAIHARDSRQARTFMRKRHGTCGAPYSATRATYDELKDHLGSGGMFWDAFSETIMPRGAAHAIFEGMHEAVAAE